MSLPLTSSILCRTVSTPFLYLPHSRPSASIPVPLVATSLNCGFTESPDWKLFSSTLSANQPDVRDVVAKVRSPVFISRGHNLVEIVLHSHNTNILYSPTHPVPPIVPLRHRILAHLHASRSCGWSGCSEETDHTDSTHATDVGGCSVSFN